jgi:hypothetical protein
MASEMKSQTQVTDIPIKCVLIGEKDSDKHKIIEFYNPSNSTAAEKRKKQTLKVIEEGSQLKFILKQLKLVRSIFFFSFNQETNHGEWKLALRAYQLILNFRKNFMNTPRSSFSVSLF